MRFDWSRFNYSGVSVISDRLALRFIPCDASSSILLFTVEGVRVLDDRLAVTTRVDEWCNKGIRVQEATVRVSGGDICGSVEVHDPDNTDATGKPLWRALKSLLHIYVGEAVELVEDE